MTAEEKIFKVMKVLNDKFELAPKNAKIRYRAGEEKTGLKAEEEILILNKICEENVINIVSNFANEYI